MRKIYKCVMLLLGLSPLVCAVLGAFISFETHEHLKLIKLIAFLCFRFVTEVSPSLVLSLQKRSLRVKEL